MGTSLPSGGCIKNPSKPNSVHCTHWLLAVDHCLWPQDSLRSDNLQKNAVMVTDIAATGKAGEKHVLLCLDQATLTFEH